jgi:hypothetical protein
MPPLTYEAVEQQIAQDEQMIARLQARIKALRHVQLLLKSDGNPLVASELVVDQSDSLETKQYGLTYSSDAAPTEAMSKRGRKPKGELSLANLILQILADHPSGLTSSELIRNVLQSGYKTGSEDFTRVVASTLSNLKSKNLVIRNDSGSFLSVSHHLEKEVQS